MLNDKPTEVDQSAGWLYKSRMTEYGLFLKNVSDSGIDCLSGLYEFEVLTAAALVSSAVALQTGSSYA